MKKKTILIILCIILILGLIINLLISSKNLSKIPGGFEKVAFVRNENNVEKILKIYAVCIADIKNADFKSYGNALPYNGKSGQTIIYFFDQRNPYPTSLSLNYPHFDTLKYKAIAQYNKNVNSAANLIVK